MEEEQKNDSNSGTKQQIEPVGMDYPGGKTLIRGKWYRQEDHDEVMRQLKAAEAAKREREEHEYWQQTAEGRLCLDLYKAFHKYRDYIREHHFGWGRDNLKFKEHRLFAKALLWADHNIKEREESYRQNTEKAQLAERCEHLHANGTRCGSPKMNGGLLCYKHQRMEEARAMKLDLGTMEDPEAIHLGIMKLQRAVIDGTLDGKQVTQLTNLMQIAAWNAKTKASRKEEKS
jgi:hypothetical protein